MKSRYINLTYEKNGRIDLFVFVNKNMYNGYFLAEIYSMVLAKTSYTINIALIVVFGYSTMVFELVSVDRTGPTYQEV